MIRHLTILIILISCKPDSDLKIKDIGLDKNDVFLYEVVKEDSNNPLDWRIEPRKEKLIPNTNAHFIVRAKMIHSNKTLSDCFASILLPERIVDFVIYKKENELEFKAIYELYDIDVIPSIASETFGDYELYYSKKYPEIGIEILKFGLNLANDPSVIAEDLGYILRDENRYEEALEAFLISEQHGVSSEYIFKEIHDLHLTLGDEVKAKEYEDKAPDF